MGRQATAKALRREYRRLGLRMTRAQFREDLRDLDAMPGEQRNLAKRILAMSQPAPKAPSW